MIQPLTIQDPTKPLVVNFSNKKAASNYFYNEPLNLDFSLPSITFSNKNSGSKEIILPVKKSEEDTSDTKEILLPHPELICLLYFCYAICIGIGNLLFPYYTAQVALLFCPLFTITVIAHTIITQNLVNFVLGLILVGIYPLVVFLNVNYAYVTFLCLFNMFCSYKVFTSKIRYVHIIVTSVFILASIIGIIVYQVYPKSIHGMHAAFLSTCMLACASVLFCKKCSYKVVCISHSQSINVLAS